MIILPRQARDKHRENSKTGRFLHRLSQNGLSTIISSVRTVAVRKTPFCKHFDTKKGLLYHDRLGTNEGRVEGQGVFSQETPISPDSSSMCARAEPPPPPPPLLFARACVLP
jgi:hypothetical protein